MSLSEKIRTDMVAAMKAKDQNRVAVLRMLMSAIKDAAIAERGELDDDGVIKILMSYAKKREESRVQMTELGRDDLAANEERELTIVKEYLPEALGDDELADLVRGVIADLGAESMKDMGRVMKECVSRAEGRADGNRISALVKAQLSS